MTDRRGRKQSLNINDWLVAAFLFFHFCGIITAPPTGLAYILQPKMVWILSAHVYWFIFIQRKRKIVFLTMRTGEALIVENGLSLWPFKLKPFSVSISDTGRLLSVPEGGRKGEKNKTTTTSRPRKSQTSLIPVALLYFHSPLFNVFVIICIPSDQWVNRSIHNKWHCGC